jgi:hypothetical protein
MKNQYKRRVRGNLIGGHTDYHSENIFISDGLFKNFPHTPT